MMSNAQPRPRSYFRTAGSMFTIVLAAVLTVQSALMHSAVASPARCEAIFLPRVMPEGTRLYDTQVREIPTDALLRDLLPTDRQDAFDALAPKLQKKFQKRFNKRQSRQAWSEAQDLVAALIYDPSETNTKFASGRTKAERLRTLTNVLHARRHHTTAQVDMEKLLLEIGYGEGSARQQRWSDFRSKYSRWLATATRYAINVASTFAVGLPLSTLKSQERYQAYRPTRTERHFWNILEPAIREKTLAHNKSQLRDLHIELAVKLVSRILAAAVLMMVIDHLLEQTVPSYHLFKMQHGGDVVVESRAKLEKMAYDEWKNWVEIATGERPSDQSPEALEIRERIDATSKAELWKHVHEGGPLKEEAPPKPSQPGPRPEADQTSPEPSLPL